MSAFSRVVLLSLRDGRNPEAFAKNVEPWGSVLLEVARSPNGLAALGVLLRYHHQVSRRPPSEVPKLFAAAGAEVMDAMKAGAEFFFADALREGRELGLQQGLQEGQLKATRTLVARLLTVRFGDLPPAVTSRIDAATLEELDRWGVGLLTANSLAELFGTT